MSNKYMAFAIEEAKKAYSENEIPVGAVIERNGVIIALAHNEAVKNNNPMCHAELTALMLAKEKISDTYLSDCSLYVTKEPCIMCMGAIINLRIKRVYFGAYDTKYGAEEHVLGLMKNKKLNYYIEFYGGIMEEECKSLLTNFFKDK